MWLWPDSRTRTHTTHSDTSYRGICIPGIRHPNSPGCSFSRNCTGNREIFTPLARHEAVERQCLINRHISISSSFCRQPGRTALMWPGDPDPNRPDAIRPDLLYLLWRPRCFCLPGSQRANTCAHPVTFQVFALVTSTDTETTNEQTGKKATGTGKGQRTRTLTSQAVRHRRLLLLLLPSASPSATPYSCSLHDAAFRMVIWEGDIPTIPRLYDKCFFSFRQSWPFKELPNNERKYAKSSS